MLRQTFVLATAAAFAFLLAGPIAAATQTSQGQAEVVAKTCKAGYKLNTKTNKCVKQSRGSFH